MDKYRNRMGHAGGASIRMALIVCTLILLLFAAAGGAAAPSMPSTVISSGTSIMEYGDYHLHVTIGQPVAGTTSAGGQYICVGFQCTGQARYSLFLPAIHR